MRPRRAFPALALVALLALVAESAPPALAQPFSESQPSATDGVATPAEPASPAAPAADPAAAAPEAAAPAVPERSRVDVLLHRRLNDSRLGRMVSMLVIDADTGAVVSSQLPDRPMQAASNMKIVTAVNAIATMGADKRFTTTVLAGRAKPDVILQGAGDPLLSRGDLASLAARTAKKLKGRSKLVVHIDGDLFPRPTMGPGWVDAYVGSSTGFVQALAIRGDRSRHPSRNAAEVFASALRKRGLSVRVGRNQDAAADAPVLARARGHSVAASLGVMLNASESGIAEVLFRQVAIAQGLPPTWAGSQQAALQSLATLGIDATGMVLADGSGLSRLDAVSPRFLTEVIRVALVLQAPRFEAIFRPSSMPIAGRTGTLNTSYGRYSTRPSSCARGKVQAKTGTILSTIALSGVAKTEENGRRIFSVIVNNRPLRYSALQTRRAVDALAATVTGCWK